MVGMITPQSYFRQGGPAQQLTDIGGMGDNVRFIGCDLFTLPIVAGSSATTAGFGGVGKFYTPCAPGDISPRLLQFEELYQYYAIRKIQFLATPEVGTNTNVSATLALIQDEAIAAGITAPTNQQLLEITPAMKWSVGFNAQLTYEHKGTRLWVTSTEGSEVAQNNYQLDLACVLSGTPVASTLYATLWVEYIIDFYKPCMILGSPSLQRKMLHRQRRSEKHIILRQAKFREQQLLTSRLDAEDDEKYLLIRTSESEQDSAPSTGTSYQLKSAPRREEVKAQLPARSVSLKG
jgi:hypothetical protein